MALLKSVDSTKWWAENAGKFPCVSRVSARFLAKPGSNAFQESVFSLCKLVDTDQRQRLGSVKFEMLVLLAINAKWINQFCVITNKDLVEAINSASSAAECLKELVKFFDNDDHDHSDLVSSLERSFSESMGNKRVLS